MVKKKDKFYDPELSLSKLIIYFHDGNVRTFHSNLRKDSRIGMIRSAEALTSKLLFDLFKNKWMTGMLIENCNGKVMQKYYCGKLKQSFI